MITTNEIRSKFIDFFIKEGHTKVESSSLVPHNDPSLMFTNSGMVQFKNYFTGVDIPKYTRATTAQKCVRAGGKHNDLENVGYTARHHTFFEMLGNFSFGDYFKEKAIFYAWNLLTKEFGINKNKLYITVYHNDDEAFNYWKSIGVAEERIIRISTNDNFWSMGDTGPCGPCSEIFYDHGEHLYGGLPGTEDQDGERYVEIWNLVFMQFEQLANGEMIKLPNPSIDTGMGLERFASVMNGVYDNYQIDLFKNIMNDAESFIKTKITEENISSYKVIADHLRSTAFLIADGIIPSNEGRGYVLRRIMRRAMRHVHHLGSKENIIHKLVPSLIREMGNAYPELQRMESFITDTIYHEEMRFSETLDRGIKLLTEESSNLSKGDILSGEVAFKLYDTYGFPLDLTTDILRKRDISVDMNSFKKAMEKQKEMARKSWLGSGETITNEIWFDLKNKHGATEFLGYKSDHASAIVQAILVDGKIVSEAREGDSVCLIVNQTPFYGEAGGQMGDSGIIRSASAEINIEDTKKQLDMHLHYGVVTKGTIKTEETVELSINKEERAKIRANHSATHLLHAALRNILGNHIVQKGSLVAANKFRFDFSHNKSLSTEEIRNIEIEVNKLIQKNTPVSVRMMDRKEAIDSGAMALFGEKYGDEVRVIFMGDIDNKAYSIELCGGTHVERTGDIGSFKIISESAIASGVRRIEAITGEKVLEYIYEKEDILSEIGTILKVSSDKYIEAIEKTGHQLRKIERDLVELQRNILDSFLETKYTSSKGSVVMANISNMNFKDLKSWIDNTVKVYSDHLVIVLNKSDKPTIVVGVGKDLISRVKARDIAKSIVTRLDGIGSGGSDTFAQGSISTYEKFKDLKPEGFL